MTNEIEYKEAKILAHTIVQSITLDAIKKECPTVPEIKIEISREVTDNELTECLQLLNSNLGKTYESVNGKKWKTGKREEMLEEGLVYVLFRLLDSDKLLGFMSMKLINERSLQVLYLYEIQLDEHYRNMKLGSFLMKKLEVIVKSINKEGKLKKLWYKTYKDEYHDSNDSNLILTGVALTVFSVNKKARGLYNRLGYTLHRDSEIEKVLRNGKIIEPDYYMLEKVVN